LLHLGWIDKLLENISTIFTDVYKDQLLGNRNRITTYRFEPYFEQQVRELEDNTGGASEAYTVETGEKKDSLVSSDNGGPPPPPIPGLMKGMNAMTHGIWKFYKLTSSSAAKDCASRGYL
jgi:signal recognition particle receptor subunit alpha